MEGKYAETIDLLENLVEKLDSEEHIREAYLYLGRAYLAIGEYDRAIDAFTAGASYGAASPFREYLLELQGIVEASPERTAKAARISRRQLALSIDRIFYQRDPGPAQVRTPGAGENLEPNPSVARGVMTDLPDGLFHEAEFVTRGSFYVTVCRLLRRETITAGPAEVFPAGFGWVIQRTPESSTDPEDRFISGREAIDILERVALLKDRKSGG